MRETSPNCQKLTPPNWLKKASPISSTINSSRFTKRPSDITIFTSILHNIFKYDFSYTSTFPDETIIFGILKKMDAQKLVKFLEKHRVSRYLGVVVDELFFSGYGNLFGLVLEQDGARHSAIHGHGDQYSCTTYTRSRSVYLIFYFC